MVLRKHIALFVAGGLRYLWALPCTLVGLAFALCASRMGARVTRRRGVLEVQGPGVGRLVDALAPPGCRIRALTLGHVVLARDAGALEGTRGHEATHVRQYERWGPAFLPAYVIAGVVAGLRGGDSYRDSIFERSTPSPR
ncbi:MAG: hypothetical protein IH936_12050 [Acidobacteria bacterium]|nr:hypothetical protein [Acidobacteriota bacterium]